jgi:uncharacterized short protein YbdD (DUF466 family)
MRRRAARAWGALRWYVRELTGESGYDRYVDQHGRRHPGAPLLSRAAFERRRQDLAGRRPQQRCC